MLLAVYSCIILHWSFTFEGICFSLTTLRLVHSDQIGQATIDSNWIQNFDSLRESAVVVFSAVVQTICNFSKDNPRFKISKR